MSLPLALLSAALLCAQETPAVQRYLADLYLGDFIEDVQKIYTPVRPWPSYVEPKGSVTRFKLEKASAKPMPRSVETLWLGMKKGRAVEIQLIYDARYSKQKPVEALVEDLALIYGEPRRTDDRFWWTDGKAVLRVFPAEVPVLLKGGGRAVELRTSLQLLDARLFERED